MLIYLAGAMTAYDLDGCFEKATEWRGYVTNHFDCNYSYLHTFDPSINYSVNKEYNSKGVVNQNLTYLKKSDIILVNLDELDKSPGTLFEIYYAYLNNIPVVAFNSNYLYGIQPHITESITMKFKNMFEAIDYVGSMYSQDNK